MRLNRPLQIAAMTMSLVVVWPGSSGCTTVVGVERRHTIKIDTDPPGALVSEQRDSGDKKKILEPAPIDVEFVYRASRNEFNAWWWAVPVGFLAIAAVGGGIASTSDSTGVGELLMAGSFAIGAPITLGIEACAIFCGSDEVPERPGAFAIYSATAPGRIERSKKVSLGDADSTVLLRLAPASAVPATALVDGLAPNRDESVAAGLANNSLVSGTPQPAAYALIVGIEKYRDVVSAGGARMDAEQFAALASTTLGVDSRNVRMVLDERATKTDIEREMDWIRANVRPGGRIFFMFSGHGAPDLDSGSAFLVPYDGDPANLRRSGLSLDLVLSELATSGADVVAFVDSCFSGAGGRSVLPVGTRPLVPVRSAVVSPRVSLFTASLSNETAGTNSRGGGLFSSFVVEGIGSGKADINGDGIVSLGELFDWVGPRVTAEARRNSRAQTPALWLGDGASAVNVNIAFGVSSR